MEWKRPFWNFFRICRSKISSNWIYCHKYAIRIPNAHGSLTGRGYIHSLAACNAVSSMPVSIWRTLDVIGFVVVTSD